MKKMKAMKLEDYMFNKAARHAAKAFARKVLAKTVNYRDFARHLYNYDTNKRKPL